ncbi:hypothetical protein PsYK624_042220 [Phanerochaete sordida]|uniref:DNA-binding protein RAP1 n=1 Tax=Phanerochaete sordida TaxID=48140 RepID=A0A9P3G5A9_9APHY|nr:hypothetical protein PsYK624_042220 [Phanerochaete sordida]
MSENVQAFVNKKGEVVKFYLITGPTHLCTEGGLGETRARSIQREIERYGGIVAADMDDADVWIVNDGVLETYQEYCLDDPDHRAVGPGFIKKCIKWNAYQEEPPILRTTMRGIHPGKKAFTKEEKELLCEWIAQKIPDKEAGGRFGVKVYTMLVERGAQFPNGRWGLATEHTMASWKEHYKKNWKTLDKRINQIVAQKGYTVASKVAYRHDRRLNKRKRYVQMDADDEDGENLDGQGEFVSEDEEEARPQKRQRIVRREEEEEEEEEDGAEALDDQGEFVAEEDEEEVPPQKRHRRFQRREEQEEVPEDSSDEGEFAAEEDEEEDAPPQKRERTIQREEEEEEDEEEEVEAAPQPSDQYPQLDEEDEGEFQALPEDLVSSPIRRLRIDVIAEEAAPLDTQRTLVNPSPRAVRTHSRTNSNRERVSRSTPAEVESDDEWPSTLATAVAVSSNSKKSGPSERAARRSSEEPMSGKGSPTSESAREVEHTLGDDELEARRSFETETDDARARDEMFADENILVSESENPFEFSDDEP